MSLGGVSDSVGGLAGKSLQQQKSTKPTPNQKQQQFSMQKKNTTAYTNYSQAVNGSRSDGENDPSDFKTTTLRFTNNNFCMEVPRGISPNTKQIGGDLHQDASH